MPKLGIEATDFGKDYAEPVGNILTRWIKRSGLVPLSDRERLCEAWQTCLGPDAQHTRLIGLQKHVATFAVDSSPLLSELNNFRKADLLAGLRQEFPSYFIRDLRFRLDNPRPPKP